MFRKPRGLMPFLAEPSKVIKKDQEIIKKDYEISPDDEIIYKQVDKDEF